MIVIRFPRPSIFEVILLFVLFGVPGGTAVNGLFASAASGENLPLCLHLRYRDTGADARVIVRIKQVSFRAQPGETDVHTLITFDSNSRPFLEGRKYVWTTVCSPDLGFGFYESAYFAEVELWKLQPTGDPASPPQDEQMQEQYNLVL